MSTLGELYIIDEEYTGSSSAYETAIDEIQNKFDSFNAEVKNMVSSLAIQGNCALRLDEFVSLAVQALGSKYVDAMGAHSAEMKAYVDAIDTADDILY